MPETAETGKMIMEKAMEKLTANLRQFIELSQMGHEKSWDEWISATAQKIEVNCWQKKKCDNRDCPAYMNTCGRCWLIAGTMCGTCAEGEFAKKYKTCLQCDVFQTAAYKDPETELRELLLILVFSLRSKHLDLQEATENMKILRGLLPICCSCKKIRNDKGYWQQIEGYVRDHSEAEFSHGYCPDCGEKALEDLKQFMSSA